MCRIYASVFRLRRAEKLLFYKTLRLGGETPASLRFRNLCESHALL